MNSNNLTMFSFIKIVGVELNHARSTSGLAGLKIYFYC